MVSSLTLMMNRIKQECSVPDNFRLKNITAIWKGKGSKMELDKDRGIFTATVLDNILQNLMLRDNYPEIDSNMSDSNIGARKGRNIRDHTFVINGVIAETLATKGASTELIICDYSKCFDMQDVDSYSMC